MSFAALLTCPEGETTASRAVKGKHKVQNVPIHNLRANSAAWSVIVPERGYPASYAYNAAVGRIGCDELSDPRVTPRLQGRKRTKSSRKLATVPFEVLARLV